MQYFQKFLIYTLILKKLKLVILTKLVHQIITASLFINDLIKLIT